MLQISDPDLQAQQFDLVEVSNDLAIVLTRDADGAPLAPGDVRYAYIPNMHLRQIGLDASSASQNIVMSNGGQLWVGDRATDTVADDSANAVALGQTSDSAQVVGLGGADTITTGSGNDRVYGNIGADVIDGGAGTDSLYGGQNDDTVAGQAGDDNVAGDLGDDSLDGGAGNDILYGGAGSDTIETGTGDDTVFAGAGDDALTLNNSATGDKLVYMDKGQDFLEIASTTGDHTVYLGDNNDVGTLAYNAGDIQILGGGGNDTITTQNFGADTLDGGDDDDQLIVAAGSIGAKTLIGGEGKDMMMILDDSGDLKNNVQPETQVDVAAGGGDDTVFYVARGLSIADVNDGGAGDDVFYFENTHLTLRDLSLTNIETVYFSGGADSVVFADGNNVEAVFGGFANDTLDASAESSSGYLLDGGAHDDSLIGGAGDDLLHGGQGADTMGGNEGADTFQFIEPPNADGNYDDVLLDFTGGVDKLAINGDAFGGIGAIEGYQGASGAGSDANDNLLIATGQSYAGVADFETGFLDGAPSSTAKPGFYIFVDSTSGKAELWFDGDMTDASDAVHLATFDNITSTSQLAQLDEGPGGGNSGDFIII